MTTIARQPSTRPIRVVAYDAAEKRRQLAWSWKLGASLLGFDVVIPATRWEHIIEQLAMKRVRSVIEFQYWGHGYKGGALIKGEPFDPRTLRSIRGVMAPDALWWWRTCASFAGVEGQRFARACVDALGQRVAGSTFNIGVLHSGQRSLRPAITSVGGVTIGGAGAAMPHWPDDEGLNDDGSVKNSSLKAPNTIPFYTKSLPTDW